MTFEDYQVWGWSFYALAAIIVLGVTLRITLSWPLFLRSWLRVTAFVIMAVPWYVQGNAGPMAPAIIISFFEALTLDLESWARAGKPLLLAMAGGYVLMLLYWFYARKQVQEDAEPVPARTEPHL
ncbi:hypothetical protein SAMN02745127_02751 [Oceanospirillum multiglobuliferum]|uniref:MFS transporter n=1 Tax=Oceanospirillum multiglobuliferum TaxID=64969 RepID=A0A1T4S514_9GAMM|nr:hypothetical protein [Oceanospirillum multiglobuliferum]OPX54439.1 hypothetical protein BTE48_14065 [Oceanospirillum multiglobuliferum]SKA23237.1 hypothetical protein SAMN02745127_02751 [Oceanospirillum multiglobuliferum]